MTTATDPQATTVTREGLAGRFAALAAEMRQYCRQQAKLWLMVPRMALEADLGLRPDSRLWAAYAQSRWPVRNCDGRIVAYVDCRTGEIVRDLRQSVPLGDSQVVTLDPDDLDANAVLGRLGAEMAARHDYPKRTLVRDQLRRQLFPGSTPNFAPTNGAEA